MIQNNNDKKRRLFSAILLSFTILMVAKEFKTKIFNDNANDMNNNSGIIYLDDDKMVIDGQILEIAEIPGSTYIGNGKYVKENAPKITAPYGYEFSSNNTCTKIKPIYLPSNTAYLNGNIIPNVFYVAADGFILETNGKAIRLNEENTEELLNKYPGIDLENKMIDLSLCDDYADIIFLQNNEVVIRGVYFTVAEKVGFKYVGCGIFYDIEKDCFIYGYQIKSNVVEISESRRTR